MSIQFQGIYHLAGAKDAVTRRAKKYEKGIYVQLSEFRKGKGHLVVLNGEDAKQFWKDQGVDLTQKSRFVWYRPIRSLRALISELRENMAKMQPFFNNMNDYKRRVEAFLAKHPKTDVSGQPVQNIQC